MPCTRVWVQRWHHPEQPQTLIRASLHIEWFLDDELAHWRIELDTMTGKPEARMLGVRRLLTRGCDLTAGGFEEAQAILREAIQSQPGGVPAALPTLESVLDMAEGMDLPSFVVRALRLQLAWIQYTPDKVAGALRDCRDGGRFAF